MVWDPLLETSASPCSSKATPTGSLNRAESAPPTTCHAGTAGTAVGTTVGARVVVGAAATTISVGATAGAGVTAGGREVRNTPPTANIAASARTPPTIA